MLTITSPDLRNSAFNMLKVIAHLGVGFVTAVAVNKLFHNLLKVNEDSKMSYVIRASAFCAGMAASVYLGAYTTLVTFTARQTLEMLALTYGMYTAASCITGNVVYFPYAEGSFFGLMGQQSLLACGGLGAFVGAIV